MGVRHYRIDKGIRCEVRAPSGTDWRPHTTTRRMWFTTRSGENGKWLFTTPDGWQLLVEPSSVSGSAANEPAENEVVLTRELLNRARNGDGQFTGDQLEILGLTKPLLKGWFSGLVGKRIGAEEYRKLVALKKPYQPRPGTRPSGVPA